MSDENITTPTMNTILERIEALDSSFRSEIASLRTEVASLRVEVHNEIASLRVEVHNEIASLRAEVHDEITSLRRDVHVGFDRVESHVMLIHSKVLDMRADFTESIKVPV
jgi:hypothetical protein